MSAPIDDAMAARLAKILGLLGSPHDGERAAAAAKADEIVRGAGLTWRDVVVASPSIVPPPEWPSGWRLRAAECLAHRESLDAKEADFVATLVAWRGEPSSKQLAWLAAIHERVCGGVTV